MDRIGVGLLSVYCILEGAVLFSHNQDVKERES